jgi:hypothetical protein
MTATAEQLFSDYDQYRLHTTHYRATLKLKGAMRSPKKTPDRLAQLERLIVFCSENDLEPRLYLYSLFKARNWNYAPMWNQLVPGSNATKRKAIERYKTLTSIPIYAARLEQEHIQNSEVPYDPNRDISETTENIKRRYLANYNTDRCMAEMQTVTLGYHPRSIVCARCPVAQECEQRLCASVSFDIVALRRGDISLEQARRIAGRFNATR